MIFIRGEGRARPRSGAFAGSSARRAGGAALLAAGGVALGACSLILDFSEPEHDAGGIDSVDHCGVYEPNDSRDEPHVLLADETGPAALCPAGERDFYRFTLAEGQDLDLLIGFANHGGAGDLELRLYNDAGVKIAESLSFDDDEQITRSVANGNALPGGEYTFEVFGQSAAVENDYTITLTRSGTAIDAGVDAATDAGAVDAAVDAAI